MLGFAIVSFAVLCVGFALLEVARNRFADELNSMGALELLAAAGLAGLSAWLAGNWLLALTHTLNRATLLGLTALFCAVSAWIILRRWRDLRTLQLESTIGRQLWFLLPLLLWIAFILWRGSVLPPLSHDVLGYHLPKAVLIMKAHGFEYFPAPDSRISGLPSNYELLLTDVLLLSGSDRLTEWISTATFLLFLVSVGAVAQRWWGHRMSTVAVLLATASAPVLLLHSGADKNDLMVGYLAICALLWGSRWASGGGTFSLMMLITALTTGAGTKPQQAAILVGLLPFLSYRAIRDARRNWRVGVRLAAAAVLAIGWFALTGGAAYAFNALHAASPMAVKIREASSQTAIFEWGDWNNLWQVPYLLLVVPFSNPTSVWVPWRSEYWFWPHYEIFFAHFGRLLSILMVGLPVGIYFFRHEAPKDRRRERLIFTLAAFIALLITLPIRFRPLGFFGTFARYVLFVLPVIVCWTIPPFYRRFLESSVKGRRMAYTILALLAVNLSATSIDYAHGDRFAPLNYAVWAAQNPGTRIPWFSQHRAGTIADSLAGPYDVIAVDGSWDTWIYPLYGAKFTRVVEFLQPAAKHQLIPIPANAQWVIVDRSRNLIWGHPDFHDMGQFFRLIGRGYPLPEDVRVFNQLSRDPQFVLIYHEPRTNQAIFWRRVAGAPIPQPMIMRFNAQ